MSRPIGHQIRALLSASDKLQRPVPALELARVAGLALDSGNCTRICRRAESYGLMDIAAERPLRFIARPGWRESLGQPRRFVNPRLPTKPHPARVINSVWSLCA